MSGFPPKRGRDGSNAGSSDQPPSPSSFSNRSPNGTPRSAKNSNAYQILHEEELPDEGTMNRIMEEVNNPNADLDALGLTLAENGMLDIDPEVAALVVRQYLLPMFEGGVVERPELHEFISHRRPPGGLIDLTSAAERHRKSTADKQPAAGAGERGEEIVDENDDEDDDVFPSLVEHGAPSDGIYAELKLSDRLLDQLHMTKEEKIDLQRRLYSSDAEHQRLDAKLKVLKSHKDWLQQEMSTTKEAEFSVRMMSSEFESECKLMSKQTISLREELKKQKAEHEKLSSRLVEEESKVERLTQLVEGNENTSSLSRLENQVLVDQVRSLHSAVTQLNDAKSLQDELSFQQGLNDSRAAQVFSYKNKIHEEQLRMVRY